MRYFVLLFLIFFNIPSYANEKCYLTTDVDQQGNPVVMPVSGWRPKNTIAEVAKHQNKCPTGDVVMSEQYDDPSCGPEGVVETVQNFIGMTVCPKLTRFVFSPEKAEQKRKDAEAKAAAEAAKQTAAEQRKAALILKCKARQDPDVCDYLFEGN